MTDEEKFLRVLDDYAHATIDIDTAGSVEALNEASQRRQVIKKMLLDLYRKPKDDDTTPQPASTEELSRRAHMHMLQNTLDARDKQVTDLYNELQWYKESYSQLDQRIMQALRRYDHDENARQGQGFPRGEVAWAMASDLRPPKKETP